jgi:glycosyltransferase involved in cell wall biosynthesis
MKILFLAPEPFYQERGTPIAVKLVLRTLSKRGDCNITLLTYNEGRTVEFPNVNYIRIPSFGLKGITPGISIKKLFCDIIFYFTLMKLLWQNRKDQFQLIHAVEESVFMALFINFFLKIPYLYDMDSSLAMQIIEKWPWAKPLGKLFEYLEGLAIRQSSAVVPVCYDLYLIAEKAGAKENILLSDVSLLDQFTTMLDKEKVNIKITLNLSDEALIGLYIGNLEKYQGIDLLIDSFKLISNKLPNSHIVIVGGSKDKIEHYNNIISSLGLSDNFHFIAPQPVSHLRVLTSQADILLSPRITGNNTPMKVYSYMHSGVPIVATNLPTHTQVLNSNNALLGNANPNEFAGTLFQAFNDKDLRNKIGSNAQKEANEKYIFPIFENNLNQLYNRLKVKLHIDHEKPAIYTDMAELH